MGTIDPLMGDEVAKKLIKTKYFPLLLMLVFSGGCLSLVPSLNPPTVGFEQMVIEDMGLFEGTLVFTYTVNNPNPMGAYLQNLSYRLTIDDEAFASGVVDKGVALPPSGSASIRFPVKINYFEALDSLTAFAQQAALPYQISGTFGIMGLDVPYQTQGTLKVPELPKIAIEHLEIKKLSWMGADARFVVQINNPNPFPIQPAGLAYAIQLGEITFVEGSVEQIPPAAANGQSTINIPLKLDFIKLGQSAYALVKAPNSPYDLTGQILFHVPGRGVKKFPFHQAGKIPLTH